MNMKLEHLFTRALVLLLALVMVLSMAACGETTTPDADPDNPDVTEPDNSNRVEPEPIVEPENMKATFAKYPDVYAWLQIPGTSAALNTPADVSYPVAQHPTDRLFYLNRNLDGNNDKAGTIFSEATCEGKTVNSRDLDDPVTVLYGHNMANRTMFGGLQSYLSKMDFSEKHLVYMYQKDRRITYQIVGGVQYDTSHIIYYHDFNSDEVFNSFFDQLWKETDSTTNLDKANKPVAGDKVLILSVCKNGDDNHRYLIVCKMIEDTADPTTWPLASDADTKTGGTTDTKTDTKADAKSDIKADTKTNTKTAS